MRLKAWHCLALLTIAVFVAYYPTLHAGFNSTDDLKMIAAIEGGDNFNTLWFFVQKSSYYYRPLTIITFFFDRELWGMVASFMHLENVLLHLGSSLMVYGIARLMQGLREDSGRKFALFSALVFAIHPITTESVAWISGRTDLLMAFFLLFAVWLALVGMSTKRRVLFVGTAIFLILASLAKEVAVFVLPGLLWLILVYPADGKNWRSRLYDRWVEMAVVTASVVMYFVLRSWAIASDVGMKAALKGIESISGSQGLLEYIDRLRIAFKVYGFYFKKLFIPWPLNFAIVEISDWYVLAGVLLVIVLFCLAWRADVPGAFGLMAFCVLSPALLVVYGKMTWTPLAERYLYASAAFSAPCVVWLLADLRTRVGGRVEAVANAVPIVLLLLWGATTLHRAWVWQDNLRLYKDTVEKSPDFLPAKTELASALLRRGREAEARRILGEMHADDAAPDYINDDLNLAMTYLAKGEDERAYNILLPLLDKNPKKRFAVLQSLIRTNDMRLGKVSDETKRREIHQQNLEWLLEEQRLRPGPFIKYRIAKRYLALGEIEQALAFFKEAYSQAPDDAHYREAAKTFIHRLEKQ